MIKVFLSKIKAQLTRIKEHPATKKLHRILKSTAFRASFYALSALLALPGFSKLWEIFPALLFYFIYLVILYAVKGSSAPNKHATYAEAQFIGAMIFGAIISMPILLLTIFPSIGMILLLAYPIFDNFIMRYIVDQLKKIK